jgi:hypothetical protein
MNNVGILFATTGGYKAIRAIDSFKKMEPELEVHAIVDISSNYWKQQGHTLTATLRDAVDGNLLLRENSAHINGILNQGIELLADAGYPYVCVFHDDLVFSPFNGHKSSVSKWFTPELLSKSAITFCHLECFKISQTEQWARRHPSEWDKLDLTSSSLWQQLMQFKRGNAAPIYPRDADWYCHYEGCDLVRKWNRLGPTGFVIPVKTWEQVGRFDEIDCVHYDQDYTIKCFRAGLPPNYAVPNVPWLHLHNQSMNPWYDPAPGDWGRTEAMVRKFGGNWEQIWGNDWEERWKD